MKIPYAGLFAFAVFLGGMLPSQTTEAQDQLAIELDLAFTLFNEGSSTLVAASGPAPP